MSSSQVMLKLPLLLPATPKRNGLLSRCCYHEPNAGSFWSGGRKMRTGAKRSSAADAGDSASVSGGIFQDGKKIQEPSQAPDGSRELALLEEIQVTHSSTGLVVDARSAMTASGRVLVVFLTHFGDFDSWELGSKLVDKLPELKAKGVEVAGIGIGTLPAARLFAVSTGFPLSKLYADPSGLAVQAMGFLPGAGRKGGALPFLDNSFLGSGYLKLMLMCAGVGSPGTLREVFRGYIGDRNAGPVFQTGSAIDLEWKGLFDVFGNDYQRPLELATLRLLNMVQILKDWKILAPRDSDMLVQRGGVLLVENNSFLWRYNDPGILGYAPVSQIVERALGSDPTMQNPIATLHSAATMQEPYESDVYDIICNIEENNDFEGELSNLQGRWNLQYNSSRTGLGPGSYADVRTTLMFDFGPKRVQKTAIIGPVDATIAGSFSCEGRVVALNFGSASLRLSSFDTARIAVPGSVARPFSAAVGKLNRLWTKVAYGMETGENETLRIIHVDSICLATRGGDNRLSLWSRRP